MTSYDVTFIVAVGQDPVIIKVTAVSALAALRTAIHAAERDKAFPAEMDEILVEAKKA